MTRDQAAALTAGWGHVPRKPFFRLWMPYLYQRVSVPSHRHAFLPLNRDYRPLGCRREGDHVDYDRAALTHGVVFGRDPAKIPDVWWNVRGDSFWLYNDSSASRFDYFERLERLMLRQIEVAGQ